jgi:alpha-tubulin suppressor-like RCC1 family protein
VAVVGLQGQDVQALVASCDNSGALLADGTYYDWGYDALGQLGDGAIGVSGDAPVKVDLPLPVSQVALGGSDKENGQTLVELSDGSFRSWGDDQFGELGDGRTTDEPSPIVFSPPVGVTYQLLASGGGTSYAVSTSGDVYAWGQGGSGQMGNGKSANQLTPLKVETGVSLISSTAQDVVTQ